MNTVMTRVPVGAEGGSRNAIGMSAQNPPALFPVAKFQIRAVWSFDAVTHARAVGARMQRMSPHRHVLAAPADSRPVAVSTHPARFCRMTP